MYSTVVRCNNTSGCACCTTSFYCYVLSELRYSGLAGDLFAVRAVPVREYQAGKPNVQATRRRTMSFRVQTMVMVGACFVGAKLKFAKLGTV
jgi:hypothetical protein